jgi:hypothetical protein
LRLPSLGLSEEFGIETIISYIHKSTKIRKLFLVIHSPGGAVSSSYKIAKALGKSFSEITVFVPYMAASGGTLISLIGEEIVMGMMSHLTPIDPQYGNTPLNSLPRAFSRLENYFKKKDKSEAPFPWIALTEKIDPMQLETYLGVIATVQSYATEIIYNTRHGKMPKAEVEKIAKTLTETIPSHSHLIGIEGARAMGLKVVSSETFGADWDVIREWIGNYLLETESKHFIRCVIPKKEKKIINKVKSNEKKPTETVKQTG